MGLFGKKKPAIVKKAVAPPKQNEEADESNVNESINNNGDDENLSTIEAFRKRLREKQERARSTKLKSPFQ